VTGGEGQGERPPIIQYWHEEVVPDYIEEAFATFREHNPDLRHLAFSESAADALISENFDSRVAEAFRVCAVPAMQADFFRYCAVHVLGGIYCDADARCVASLRHLVEGDGGVLFEGPERGHARNEIFAFGSPGHPLLRLSVDIATMNVEGRIWDKVWMATGPWIFRELIGMWRSGSIESVFAEARSSPRFENDTRRLRYFDALQARIGDDAQLARTFEGIRVSPLSEAKSLVMHGGSHFLYKQTDSHFPNFKSSIYR
jgi:mannosyltransferase OCH1-like enzyme